MGSDSKHPVHVLMVSFPAQGHVNPVLRFAKILASKGLFITFTTTQHMGQKIQDAVNNPDEGATIGNGTLRFEFFSDGWDEDEPKRYDLDALKIQLETVCRETFTQLIKQQSEAGRPVTCIINNPFIPWVLDVASAMGIPSAILWVQSCAVYSTYYHYFHNLASFPTVDQPDLSVHLPGLPVLESDEITSFLHPLTNFKQLKQVISGQFTTMSKSFCILVDSVEELEYETLRHMFNHSPLRPIGPLFKYPNGENACEDLLNIKDDCIEWLDSQPLSSVVYVSFGSIVSITKNQMEEVGRGLLSSGVTFLWVVRERLKHNWDLHEETNQEFGVLSDEFVKDAAGKGLVVPWCAQDKVLAHPSVACFLTHCGWNSTMESLTCGVPVITFPQWGDQLTNAKFLVDVFGVGVRLIRSDNDLKTFRREDVERCVVEVTRGPKAEEMKKNALKWKKGAEEAVEKGGSSYRNVEAFVDEVRQIAL